MKMKLGLSFFTPDMSVIFHFIVAELTGIEDESMPAVFKLLFHP